MRGDRFSRSSLIGMITEAQGLDGDVMIRKISGRGGGPDMKWRILTEGEERVKRQEVAVDSVKGHVDNTTNTTNRASRMADDHHSLRLVLMNLSPMQETTKPITTIK